MMILAEELTKVFDDFLAVDRVSFEVKAGQVMVLLGPNGAGKTTTVRMLTSILVPSRGKASILGFDVVKNSDRVRASVGVLTEQHGLYGRMSANEYLTFFGRLYGLSDKTCNERSSRLLEQFGLQDARKKRLSDYSKGMRQKLALVRALLHEPPVLLLDEPTSAMDPESARIVREAIETLRSRDRAIILCTHNLLEAELLADQVAIIRRGKIILQGVPKELKRNLLGPAEYEARMAAPLNGWSGQMPEGIDVVERGEDWLRFRPIHPVQENPIILRHLLDHQLQVISFQEVPRSLEQVYLKVVNQTAQEESRAFNLG
jgi:ABC-2 type transport system ATP-binding protein